MMSKLQITRWLIGISFILAFATRGMAQSSEGPTSEACEGTALAAKANSLIDVELVARAEQRADALKAQLFDLEKRELDLQTRVDDLVYQLTPDGIRRALAFVGSVRPMDELRDALRVRLEREKARLNRQLELLAARKESLEAAIDEADAVVERLGQKLDSAQ